MSDQSPKIRLKSLDINKKDSLASVGSNFSLREYLAKKVKKKVRANRWMRPSKKEKAQMETERLHKRALRKKKEKERKKAEIVKQEREARIAQGEVTTLIDYRDPLREHPYTFDEVKQNLKAIDDYTHRKYEQQKAIDFGKAFALNVSKQKRKDSAAQSIESDDDGQLRKHGDDETPPHLVQPNTAKMRHEKHLLKKRILDQEKPELKTYSKVDRNDPNIAYVFGKLKTLAEYERDLPPSLLYDILVKIIRVKPFPSIWNDYIFCCLIFAQQVFALHLFVIGFTTVRLDHNLIAVTDSSTDIDDLPLQRVLWTGLVIISIAIGVLYFSFYATVGLFQWTAGQGLIKLYIFGMVGLLVILYLVSYNWAPEKPICIDTTRRSEWLVKYVKNFYTNDGNTHLRRGPAKLMISLQESLECCGSNGYDDYLQPDVRSTAFNPAFPIPPSCCNSLWHENIYCAHLEPSDPVFPYRVNQKGCSEKLQEYCDKVSYWILELLPIYIVCFGGLYLATVIIYGIHFYTLRNEAGTANDLEVKLRNLVVKEKPLAKGTIYDQLDKLNEDRKSERLKAIEAEELLVEEDMLQLSPSLVIFLEHMQEDLGIMDVPNLHRMIRLEVKRFKDLGHLHHQKEVLEANKKLLGGRKYGIPKYLLPYAVRVLQRKENEKDYGDLKQKHLKKRLDIMHENESKKAAHFPKQSWKWEEPSPKKIELPQFVQNLEKKFGQSHRKTNAQRQREKRRIETDRKRAEELAIKRKTELEMLIKKRNQEPMTTRSFGKRSSGQSIMSEVSVYTINSKPSSIMYKGNDPDIMSIVSEPGSIIGASKSNSKIIHFSQVGSTDTVNIENPGDGNAGMKSILSQPESKLKGPPLSPSSGNSDVSNFAIQSGYLKSPPLATKNIAEVDTDTPKNEASSPVEAVRKTQPSKKTSSKIEKRARFSD